MPLRTLVSLAERNVVDLKLPPVVLAAGVAQDVLPDIMNSGVEISNREVFNAGANVAYYAYGRDCDSATNYNAILQANQMLEVSGKERLSMMSPAGTTISITVLKRDDLIQPKANIL